MLQTMVLYNCACSDIVSCIAIFTLLQRPSWIYVVSSKLAHGEAYLIQHYVIKFVSDLVINLFCGVLCVFCLFHNFVFLPTLSSALWCMHFIVCFEVK
jgi:hypothetical protein